MLWVLGNEALFNQEVVYFPSFVDINLDHVASLSQPQEAVLIVLSNEKFTELKVGFWHQTHPRTQLQTCRM